MRFAIFSDVHANLQAWNAVLSDAALQAVDRMVCLGDLVGYGADPTAVLESAYRHVDAFVLGNHDAVLAGRLSDEWFTEEARTALRWTGTAVTGRARAFLRAFPLCLTGPGFRCAHGDFAQPGAFAYISEPDDALPSWGAVQDALLFVGHTHKPGIFVLGPSGIPRCVAPQDFALEPGKRFLVNVGSVGTPRSGDALATYCLFDSETQAVHWRQVPFDLEACLTSVRRAGLPLAPFAGFARDPRDRLRTVREPMRFSPPRHATDHARVPDDTRDLLQPLLRRTRRWRLLSLAAVAVMILTLSATGIGFWYRATASDATPRAVLPPEPVPDNERTESANLLRTWPWSDQPNPRLPGWRVVRGAARQQAWRLTPGPDDLPVLVLSSGAGGQRFRVEAPLLMLPRDDVRFQARARFRSSDTFSGHVGLVFDLVKAMPDGSEVLVPVFHRQAPTLRRREGWMKAQATLSLPRHTRAIRLAIEGRFEGEVEVQSVSLLPVD